MKPRSGLYGLVSWPPEAAARWIEDFQRRHGVVGFGPPHLNLRSPFEWEGDPATLAEKVRAALSGARPVLVRGTGWHRFPTTLFLGIEQTPELYDLHARLMQIGGEAYAGLDHSKYVPHVTVALGVLPWYQQTLWTRALRETPPELNWTVDRLTLTREDSAELIELEEFRFDGDSE
ncbi:2'-5' RNA ligase [Deinobacterium chartae]|uniref:2'-5' RNA ligase n=1 Tax=Deinobacterium chartae TaxID=521158 RepID=A0A841HZN9_9DEIO|nr:2'-5' RNA ligase family protein [Deinobacterium chartae]MBB6098413.1 2'-5' RNA ligase [Deinobacterium chartae]